MKFEKLFITLLGFLENKKRLVAALLIANSINNHMNHGREED